MNLKNKIILGLIILSIGLNLLFVSFKPYPANWMKFSLGEGTKKTKNDLELDFTPKKVIEKNVTRIRYYFILTNVSNKTYKDTVRYLHFLVFLYPSEGNTPLLMIFPTQSEISMPMTIQLMPGESIKYSFTWDETSGIQTPSRSSFFILLPGEYRVSGAWRPLDNVVIETPKTTLMVAP